jgi:hypothetical protein
VIDQTIPFAEAKPHTGVSRAAAFLASGYHGTAERLTENELSDLSRLWHDGCSKTIIEVQNVDRNHSAEV